MYEQQSAIIVMATNLMERNKVRCHKYWPDPTEIRGEVYGKIKVQTVAESQYQDYVLREFQMQHMHTKESWIVFQFHYTTWPDQGVPENCADVVGFLDDIH